MAELEKTALVPELPPPEKVMTWLLQDEQPVQTLPEYIEPPLSETLAKLQTQLCTVGNPRLQRRAAQSLAALGVVAADALIYALHQNDETCQVLAAYALRKLGREVTGTLLPLIETCPTLTRQRLLWVLYTADEPHVAEALITCMSDSDRKIRRYAAWGLGHLKDTHAIPYLVEALNDPTEKIRFDAAMALVKIGGEAVDALLEALYTGNARVRSQVVSVLAWLQDDEALDALTDALHDINPQVRGQAALALGWMGKHSAVNALVGALYDSEATVRMQAAVSLGWIGDSRAVDGLLDLLSDKDDWVPYSAADALGHLGDIRAITPLRLASHGRSKFVREAAQNALHQLGYFDN
ncbi:MAG: HEAT repeat domain-containing protein [Chloroflexi bacterium]|nr:HEAT repeat domain-containing protein [Chloroflexota bacterium]MCC6893348.1 HEAT repeat domain-containing protein [Anaerolineae bacterium]